MTAVLQLQKPKSDTLEKLLEVIDAMRQNAVDGKIVAIVVAAVTPDDCTMSYAGASTGVSRLRMQGAIAQVFHSFLDGEINERDDDKL